VTEAIFQNQLLSEGAPMVSANAVTTFCPYTDVTIKRDALTAYLERGSTALSRMLQKAKNWL